MSSEDIAARVLPRLIRARVETITLTGGEPFAHPEIISICESVITNGLPLASMFRVIDVLG